MMGHAIVGGWEYVLAAYIVVWVVWGLYAVSLWRRHSNLKDREKI